MREGQAFVRGARIYFGFFFIVYLGHYFFVDLALKKQPIASWAAYRFTCAGAALGGLILTFTSWGRSGRFHRIPLAITGLLYGFMQARSMTWRIEVPYIYSVILPCISCIALRASVLGSVFYILFSFILMLPFWMTRPDEGPYIVSACMVGMMAVVVIRSRVSSDLEAFVSDQEHLETQRSRSAQVSHDIRGPLGALSVALQDSERLPEDTRELVHISTRRIRQIVGSLLDDTKARTISSQCMSGDELRELVSELILEKRIQYQTIPNLRIVVVNSKLSTSARFRCERVTLQRVLSNLMDNAVEARRSEIEVRITIEDSKTGLNVSISDNGIGIPSEILTRLGEKGFTYGKLAGNGLGLHHAKTSVEAWGGRFAVESTTNVGTTIRLFLAQEDSI